MNVKLPQDVVNKLRKAYIAEKNGDRKTYDKCLSELKSATPSDHLEVCNVQNPGGLQ